MAGKAWPTLIRACVFAAFFCSNNKVSCAEGLKRTSGQEISFANFVHHQFQYLNVSLAVPSYFVHEVSACGLACVESLGCFSFNTAAHPDINGHFLCELLASDKYNSSEKLQPHPSFHHYSIYSPCSEMPCVNGGSCIALYSGEDFECSCPPGYKGQKCETAPSDCFELRQAGVTKSGLYSVNPDGKQDFRAYCDMTTDGGGWTVFQRRQNGTQDFGQDWSAYKVGFGELNAEFWLGNEKIYRLTNGRSQGLRVEIEDWNLGKAHALYKNFEIGDERSLYLLNIGVYSGTAGDSFGSSHNKNFTTKDRDNDRNPDKNCATVRGLGGWWYKRCSWGSLNGKYLGNLADYNGITWFHYHDSWLSMKSAEMKLRTED